MTVMQITSAYGPRTGGVRTHLDHVRRCYGTRGVSAVLVKPGERDSCESDEFGLVYTVRSPRLLVNPDYRNLWSWPTVLRIVEAAQPDAIEIHDKYTLPGLAPRLRRRVGSVIGFSSERLTDVLPPYLGEGPLLRAGIRRYNRWFATRFETVVCHSRYAAGELEAVGAANVVVVPLGVDLERYRPERRDEALRAELLGDGEALLLYAGRLVREKNIRLLVDLMASAPAGWRLVVAGAGPEASTLAAARNTQLLGFVERARLAALYASCDLFVFPSTIETFALSVLEALASGCRVVAAAGGAVPEVLAGTHGRLAEPTAIAFRQAIAAALALDPAAAGRAARTRAERYRWEACADRILALHRRALAR